MTIPMTMIKKRAPKIKRAGEWLNHLNIGYAIEESEDNPSQPAFSFVGATIPLLYDVFAQIAKGGYVCKGFHLGYVRTSFNRGKHHMMWRLRVRLEDFNSQFIGLSQLRLMLEANIRGRGHRMKYFKIDTLLNL